MAGFDSLGSGFNSNVGGSFNPALGQSGQTAPAGYGLQAPHISSPYSVGSLGLGAGNRPSESNLYNATSQVYTPGPDTSAEHQANVAMAQGGFGNLGLNGYRGFAGETPGTSMSNYGLGANAWADVQQFMANPLGNWKSSGNVPGATGIDAQGNIMNNTVIPYGEGAPNDSGVAMNNTSRYQQMIDSIRSSMTNQWPSNWTNGNPQNQAWDVPVAGSYPNYSQDQITNIAADLPLRYASGYGVLSPAVTQNMGIATPSIPGMRMYS